MRVSCGVDVVDVVRVEKSLKSNARFAEKVFTKNEIEYCENRKSGRYESYAARFAAKEAFIKAMGAGLFEGVALTDIEVVNEAKQPGGSGARSSGAPGSGAPGSGEGGSGAPSYRLSGGAADIYNKIGGISLSLSLSHTSTTAIAMAVALFEDEK